MGAAVDFLDDTVGDVADFTTGAFEDVTDFVVNDILEPVVDVVSGTLEKAMDDPIGTLAMAASIAFPPFAPLIMGANTLVHGGSLEDALKGAALAYVGGQVAGAVSGEVGTLIAPGAEGVAGSAGTAFDGFEYLSPKVIGNVAGGVAKALVTGGDPLQALISGGIGAGVGELTSQIEGFSDLSPNVQRAVRGAMTAELQGKDPTQILINQALNAGMSAAVNTFPAPDVSVDMSGGPAQTFDDGSALTTAEDGTVTSTDAPADPTTFGTVVNAVAGALPEALVRTGSSGTSSSGASSSGAGPLTTGTTGTTGTTNTDTNTSANTSANTGALPSVSKPASTGALPNIMDQAATPGWYKTIGTAGGAPTPKRELEQLYSGLTAAPGALGYQYVKDETLDGVDFGQGFAAGGGVHYFNGGGLEDSAETTTTTTTGAPDPIPEDRFKALMASLQTKSNQASSNDMAKALKNLGEIGLDIKPAQHHMTRAGAMGQPSERYSPKVLPQLAALLRSRGMTLAEGGQPDDHTHPNYDGTPVFRTGGLEGLGGKYVEGKGDGTSDDISAMLANGEYVFSADVVAALGNGSNKAGADRLGEMVEAIRARARSASPDKLPPDAKSPLEYLKSSKGKKHV